MESRQMIRMELTARHDPTLETIDHLRGFGLETVLEAPEVEVAIHIDPIIGRDGAVTALERAIRTVQSEKFWNYVDKQITGEEPTGG